MMSERIKQQQIQELIERVEKILANCQQEYSDRPIPPYVFSDTLNDCKTALQEYQKLMGRVEDSRQLKNVIMLVNLYGSNDAHQYSEGAYKIAEAIQQYIRGEDE